MAKKKRETPEERAERKKRYKFRCPLCQERIINRGALRGHLQHKHQKSSEEALAMVPLVKPPELTSERRPEVASEEEVTQPKADIPPGSKAEQGSEKNVQVTREPGTQEKEVKPETAMDETKILEQAKKTGEDAGKKAAEAVVAEAETKRKTGQEEAKRTVEQQKREGRLSATEKKLAEVEAGVSEKLEKMKQGILTKAEFEKFCQEFPEKCAALSAQRVQEALKPKEEVKPEDEPPAEEKKKELSHEEFVKEATSCPECVALLKARLPSLLDKEIAPAAAESLTKLGYTVATEEEAKGTKTHTTIKDWLDCGDEACRTKVRKELDELIPGLVSETNREKVRARLVEIDKELKEKGGGGGGHKEEEKKPVESFI